MAYHRHRTTVADPGIAPPHLVRKDLDMIRARDLLRTNRDVEELLLAQSIEGRAHGGHGAFLGRRFPDTTEDDLVRALNLDPSSVRRQRQSLIAEIVEWVQRACRGDDETRLLTADHRPLLGIGTFVFLNVRSADVLRGLYLGGLRDTVEVRSAAEERYGISIGYGQLYRVDFAVMRRMGLTGDQLAHQEHGPRIEEYQRVGLITEALPSPDSTVRYMYIRHQVGPGASDDAAIVMGGLRFGGDTAVGVFLADAIDTLEKYVPAGQEGDQDAALARKIQQEWTGLDAGFDDAVELTALAVGGPGLPDSSLRHLLRVDRSVDQCPLEAHLLKAAGRDPAPLLLGHEKVHNDDFYEMMEGRLDRHKTLPAPGSRTLH